MYAGIVKQVILDECVQTLREAGLCVLASWSLLIRCLLSKNPTCSKHSAFLCYIMCYLSTSMRYPSVGKGQVYITAFIQL